MLQQDAYTGWVRSMVNDFADWLRQSGHVYDRGVRGIIGEWGVPGPATSARGAGPALHSAADKDLWEAQARFYLRELARLGLQATWWAAGTGWDQTLHGQPNDYTMLAFGGQYSAPLSTTHRGGTILSQAPTPYPGVNGVSMTNWLDGDEKVIGPRNFAFLAAANIHLVRLPFQWRDLQPVLGGSLATVGMTKLTAMLDAAAANQSKVLLDLHEFGTDGRGNKVTQEQLAELWVRLVIAVGNHTGLGYVGMMNEPNNDSTRTTDRSGVAWWTGVSTYVYKAIRVVDPDVGILVPTWDYSNIHTIRDNYPNGPWLPPEPNLWWEAHHYFDPWNGGTYTSPYATYALAVPAGTRFAAAAFQEDLSTVPTAPGAPTVPTSPPASPSAPPSPADSWLINVGGGTAPGWTAPVDGLVVGGTDGANPGTTASPSAGVPAELFATERYGEQTWTVPVKTAGDVIVRLYFAERYPAAQSPGARIFDVLLNGYTIAANYDVWSASGAKAGGSSTLAFRVKPAVGAVTVKLVAKSGSPLLNGLSVIAVPVVAGAKPWVAVGTQVKDAGGSLLANVLTPTLATSIVLAVNAVP